MFESFELFLVSFSCYWQNFSTRTLRLYYNITALLFSGCLKTSVTVKSTFVNVTIDYGALGAHFSIFVSVFPGLIDRPPLWSTLGLIIKHELALKCMSGGWGKLFWITLMALISHSHISLHMKVLLITTVHV